MIISHNFNTRRTYKKGQCFVNYPSTLKAMNGLQVSQTYASKKSYFSLHPCNRQSLTIYSIVLLWFYATCKTLQCNPIPCQRTKRIYKKIHTMQILFANLRSNSFMRLCRLYPTYVPIDGFYAPLYKISSFL